MRIEFDLNVRGDLTKADLENIKSGLTALLQNQPAFQISREPIPTVMMIWRVKPTKP